ncbi:hypothetical protein PGIGA_G00246000, partial [Pangasianodon gigas]|nr:hypothetical protein [Pangasianodon gigas]
TSVSKLASGVQSPRVASPVWFYASAEGTGCLSPVRLPSPRPCPSLHWSELSYGCVCLMVLLYAHIQRKIEEGNEPDRGSQPGSSWANFAEGVSCWWT